ncbi:MAG: heavy-metal-associated protein [Ignavibacteria bacterium]|nr:heavy-metal-associated protein [Ignavibacteria bacterium]
MKKSYFKLLAVVLIGLAIVVGNSFASVKESKIKTSAHANCCKDKVEKALKKLDGVSEVTLNLDDKFVTVKYDGDKVQEEKIVSKITDLGYNPDKPGKSCCDSKSGKSKCAKECKTDKDKSCHDKEDKK